MSNRVVVYEYVDEISYYLKRNERDKAVEALNIHLVGTNEINIACPKGIKENPKVTKHPNYDLLCDAHNNLSATSIIKVKIRVYSDGTKDMIPLEKP